MLTLPETIKLFDSDAYATDFSASVLSAELIEKKKSSHWEIVLDRTLFFPEEGGQTPDTGTIDGHPVIDVQLDGNVIRHSIKAEKTDGGQPPFAPGQLVRGQIDFGHRFSNMQNHSGEHILSGLVHNRFGYDNVGFHLSDNTVTLDFNGPLTDEDILWLEQTANRVVWDNKEIRGWYPDPEELQSIEYRSKKEIDGPLRLVEIAGVDLCACCAPHVRRTG
jgi:alanyl-tRNA synthetase